MHICNNQKVANLISDCLPFHCDLTDFNFPFHWRKKKIRMGDNRDLQKLIDIVHSNYYIVKETYTMFALSNWLKFFFPTSSRKRGIQLMKYIWKWDKKWFRRMVLEVLKISSSFYSWQQLHGTCKRELE